jgi:hypothetical protein
MTKKATLENQSINILANLCDYNCVSELKIAGELPIRKMKTYENR